MKFLYRCLLLPMLLLDSATAQNRVVPDDPYWTYQASFYNSGDRVRIDRFSRKESPVILRPNARFHMHIASAWALSTGSKEVVVALLDDGFFYNHEDLRDNIRRDP